MQNQGTLRSIRDRLFEHILSNDLIDESAQQLGTTRERFLQDLELFLETVRPGIVIVIDESNQDLTDFAHAIELSTRIYRVKKLISDGKVQYYSPDHVPVVETESATEAGTGDETLHVLELMGGGRLLESTGRTRFYELNDGRIVHIKYSKLHERQNYYWYGIRPSVMEKLAELNVSHVMFILGESGFVTVPVEVVRQYVSETKATNNPDGSIRHYHVLISNDLEPELYWSAETPRYPLADVFEPFN